jgi:hypothetical protein
MQGPFYSGDQGIEQLRVCFLLVEIISLRISAALNGDSPLESGR